MDSGVRRERINNPAAIEAAHEELARTVSASCVNIETFRHLPLFSNDSVGSFFNSLFPDPFSSSQTQQTTFPTNGAGFVVGEREILTNNHVVAHFNHVRVRFMPEVAGNKKQIRIATARVVARDRKNDLAVLRVKGLTMKPELLFAGSESLSGGQSVLAMKNVRVNHYPASSGIVEGKTSTLKTIPRALVIRSEGIQKGDSGGPVVNNEGKVVGVLHAVDSDESSVVFAVPVEYAVDIVEKAKRSKV